MVAWWVCAIIAYVTFIAGSGFTAFYLRYKLRKNAKKALAMLDKNKSSDNEIVGTLDSDSDSDSNEPKKLDI